MPNDHALFDIRGLTAVVTGGGDVLGSAMARALADAGARVAVIGLHDTSANRVVETICTAGGEAIGIACDVTDKDALERARDEILRSFGAVDILVNGAGGNSSRATTSADRSFFDLDSAAVDHVLDLNFAGTFKACQVFGQSMIERKHGCIITISSMNYLRPLTLVPAYSAAKAAVTNFTQWLAVHMAQEYSPDIRVNAIAPGFFLTEQNRFLLMNSDAVTYTPRGERILAHTPQNRLGAPEDLVGTLLWLVSPAARFVTGIVVPVDGGFSAFSGV